MLLRIRGVVTVAIAVTALSLAPVPASATPRGPVAQEKDQASVITQVWEWISVAWATVSGLEKESPPAGEGTNSFCPECNGERGGAIDPNG
jgi:hypothetical protein